MIGYALWAALLAAMLTLEGLGLTLRGHDWPTISDVFRSLTRSYAGRWIFFALWLWLGWHFFIRGWEFFLRGKGASAPGGLGGGKALGATITQVVVPLLGLFLIFMLMGRASLRALATEDADASDQSDGAAQQGAQQRRRFLRYAAMTTVGGYLLFAGVIGLYELLVGRSASGIFGSALSYGAFLAFAVALPLFVALELVESMLRARRRHSVPTSTPAAPTGQD